MAAPRKAPGRGGMSAKGEAAPVVVAFLPEAACPPPFRLPRLRLTLLEHLFPRLKRPSAIFFLSGGNSYALR